MNKPSGYLYGCRMNILCLCVIVIADVGSLRIVQSPAGYASLGSRLALSCVYPGAEPVRVTWLRGHRRKVKGQWFVLDPVRREDEGRYTCVVNAAGHVLTEDTVVRVQCMCILSYSLHSFSFNLFYKHKQF